MGRLSSLAKRLLGIRPNHVSPDGGIYIQVRCDACGEVVTGRVSPTSELSQADDGSGYFVRKVLVGRQCFRPIEVLLRYSDLRGSEISREVHGGTSVR